MIYLFLHGQIFTFWQVDRIGKEITIRILNKGICLFAASFQWP